VNFNEIYMMERSAHDKHIEDYNSMDIWDFNKKYGELWDFTVNRSCEILECHFLRKCQV
jgi:hypothetical protein